MGRQPSHVLVSELSALTRVGHKGADHIAPGNTAASFDAALAAGVDMIEFDVLPEDMRRPGESRLVLAHDYSHELTDALTLEQGLAHLAAPEFAGLELDVDLKLPGYEDRVVHALREHGLISRTLVSTTFMRSLVAVRAIEPALRLGWSVPRARKDYTRSWLYRVPAYAAIGRIRRRLPDAAREHLSAGRCDALMVHWRLVTGRLVEAVGAAGGELYVWTVDDAARIRRLEMMGVTGVITNDPRLFA
jgi:glycerophosphoryl diester phosphodiesterase